MMSNVYSIYFLIIFILICCCFFFKGERKFYYLIILGSLIGAIFAGVSLYEHVELVNNLKSTPSICNISSLINCDKVNESEYAEFLGVPIASYGLIYYIVMIFWTLFFLKSKKIKKETYANVSLVFSTGAIIYSIWLFVVSKFVIEAVCLNCIAMYIGNILQWLATLWLDRKTKILIRLEKGALALTSYPFIALWSSGHDEHPLRKEASVSACLVILLSAFVLILPNQILLPHIKKVFEENEKEINNSEVGQNEIMASFNEWKDSEAQEVALNATNDLKKTFYIGNPDAPIKIVEYGDLQCPACRMYYNTTKNLFEKYEDKILFVYKHFPIDSQCNSVIKGTSFHKHACFSSLFTLCAGEQGKYWEAMDYIYTMPSLVEGKSDTVVQKEFTEGVDILGLDKVALNECMESKRYYNRISKDIEEAKALKITGTPFVFINGKQLKNRKKEVMVKIFDYLLNN